MSEEIVSISPLKQAGRRFLKHKMAVTATVIIILLIVLATIGPNLTGYDYNRQVLEKQYREPSPEFLCGTDILGRDLLTRIFVGARVSFLVGFAAAMLSLFVGLCYGAIAGYWGGKLDMFMMRVVDILYGLPYMAYIILVITLLNDVGKESVALREHFEGWNIVVMFVALGSISWLTIARIVRAQVLSIKEKEYVESARALGVGNFRIIFIHIVPNLLGPVIVYTTLMLPSIILAESFISFLGLGVQPPLASWGVLISDGAKYINPVKIYWWLLLFPALFLGIALYCLNAIGDGLRDALDVT